MSSLVSGPRRSGFRGSLTFRPPSCAAGSSGSWTGGSWSSALRSRCPRRRTTQRFTGTFSDDGNTISGAWEMCENGADWEEDIPVTYHRAG